MTPITAATAIMVVTPEISISHRTRATMLAAAGSRGFSSSVAGSLMSEDSQKEAGSRSDTVIVTDAEAGTRIDRLLAARVADLSRSRLKALILAGEVAIGGRTIRDPGHKVNAGDDITVAVPAPEDPTPAAEAIPLNVVYEDDDLIVIDKPKGLVVH